MECRTRQWDYKPAAWPVTRDLKQNNSFHRSIFGSLPAA